MLRVVRAAACCLLSSLICYTCGAATLPAVDGEVVEFEGHSEDLNLEQDWKQDLKRFGEYMRKVGVFRAMDGSEPSVAKSGFEEPWWHMRPPELPSLMIIGAQKGGTTDMRGVLREHPNVVSSKSEIHYLDEKESSELMLQLLVSVEAGDEEAAEDLWVKFVKLWASKLKSTQTRSPLYTVLDVTPIYELLPHVPLTLHLIAPWNRLILLAREPVDRLYSARRMSQCNGHLPKPQVLFNDTNIEKLKLLPTKHRIYDGSSVEDECTLITQKNMKACTEAIHLNTAVASGLYAKNLGRFLKYFHPSRILVIDSKRWFTDQQGVMKQILEFAGLPAFSFDFASVKKRPNSCPHASKEDQDVLWEEGIRSGEVGVLRELYAPHNALLRDMLVNEFGYDVGGKDGFNWLQEYN
jgi:hypothetical protein